MFSAALALFMQYGVAQEGNPYLSHYSLPEGVSNQNWGFVQGDNGMMYVLNRKGIFAFDGLQWDNLGIQGRPIALAYSDNLFFCNDRGIGYVQMTPEGKYTQHFLVESTDENYFYKFSQLPDGLLVISPTTICRIITQPSITIDTLYFDDHPEVFISDFFELNEDIFHVKNRALIYLNKPDGGYEMLAGLPMGIDMTFSFIHGDNAFFGATNNKLYRFNGQKLSEFKIKDQDYLVASVPTSGISVDDKCFALATLNGGCLVVNADDGITSYTLNYLNGLPDDEVYSLGKDNDGGLWLSHGMGISRADLSIPVKSFGYYQGLGGNILSAVIHDHKLYVGSSEGLYLLDEKRDYKAITVPIKRKQKTVVTPPKEEPVIKESETVEEKKRGFLSRLFKRRSDKADNSEIQVRTSVEDAPVQKQRELPPKQRTIYQLQSVSHEYDKVQGVQGKVKQLLVSDGKLYAASNFGLFEISGNRVNHIAKDVNISFVNVLPNQKDTFIIGADDGAYLVSFLRGHWRITPIFRGDNQLVISAIQIDEDRFLLTNEFDVLLATRKASAYEIEEIPIPNIESNDPVVRLLDDNPYVFCSSGAYVFDAESDTFIVAENIPVVGYSSLIFNQTNYTWLKNDGQWQLFPSSKQESTVRSGYINLLDHPNYIHIQDDSSLLVINGFTQIYRIDFGRDASAGDSLGIFLRSIHDREGSLLRHKNIELTYSNNSVRVKISAPSYVKEGSVKFQYIIEGLMDDWAQWSSDPTIQFPFLPPGNHTIFIRARDVLGNVSPMLDFSIVVKPPFWQTIWFYILCGVSALVLFAAIIKVRERSLRREKEVLEQKVLERTKTIEEQKETLRQQRDHLEEYNKEILQQKAEIEAQRDEIEAQRDQIFNQNEEITQSIAYARRIQSAVMPSNEIISEILPNYFILFRPRDIVSGDFYWIGQKDGLTIVVAADCTGHGVPGAFMSMMGVSFINDIVNVDGVVSPNQILENLRQKIIATLWQTGKEGESQDGMDMAVCVYSKDMRQVQFSGAYNPLYIIRGGELIECKADKMPVGVHPKQNLAFSTHTIDLLPGDNLYIFSDGFVDQFGGPEGRKFMTKPFKKLLISLQGLPPAEQHNALEDALDKWQNAYDQVDDVLIIGIHIS